jgi:hypothetical protein
MTDDGFTADEDRMLRTLLDDILPPSDDGRLPGAGTIGLAAHIVRTVRKTPMLRPVVEYGLGALADLAVKRDPGGWAALSNEERSAVLRDFAATDQFFMPALLFLVYSGYYQHPRVVEALGLEARAPHPEGYAMEPDDWTVLEPVRMRAHRKLYRE